MATTEAAVEATDLEIDRYLQPIEVVNYFVGQVSSTNHDLIKHFRPLLVKSSLGPDNHAILKKITAQLVIVKRIQGKASFSSRYLAVFKISIFNEFKIWIITFLFLSSKPGNNQPKINNF